LVQKTQLIAGTAVYPGSSGNNLTMALEINDSTAITISGDTFEGGNDNFRLLSSDGVDYTNYGTDAELLFKVILSDDVIFAVSKSDSSGNQVIPQVSIQNSIDSSLGLRYYSDSNEVSFMIATQSANAFIIGAEDVNLYGKGTYSGNADVTVDQFIFRTARFKDTIQNLREMEIPVLQEDNIKIKLLGGVE